MADSIKFEIKATATGFNIVQKKQKELVKQTDQQAKSQDKAKKSGDNLDKQNKSLYQTNLAGSKSFSKMNQTIGTGGSSGLVGAYSGSTTCSRSRCSWCRFRTKFKITRTGD